MSSTEKGTTKDGGKVKDTIGEQHKAVDENDSKTGGDGALEKDGDPKITE